MIEVDSAGTHGFYHAGQQPDPRAMRSAASRGLDIAHQRARLLEKEDCEKFDYVLTMDEENYRKAAALCRGRARIHPLLDYASGPETEVPDPYYGGSDGFERVLDLIEDASRGLIEDIRKRHL